MPEEKTKQKKSTTASTRKIPRKTAKKPAASSAVKKSSSAKSGVKASTKRVVKRTTSRSASRTTTKKRTTKQVKKTSPVISTIPSTVPTSNASLTLPTPILVKPESVTNAKQSGSSLRHAQFSLAHHIISLFVLTVVGLTSLVIVYSYMVTTEATIKNTSADIQVTTPITLTERTFSTTAGPLTMQYPDWFVVRSIGTSAITLQSDDNAELTITIHEKGEGNIFEWLKQQDLQYATWEVQPGNETIERYAGLWAKATTTDGSTVDQAYLVKENNVIEMRLIYADNQATNQTSDHVYGKVMSSVLNTIQL